MSRWWLRRASEPSRRHKARRVVSRRRQRVRGIAMFVTLPAALLGTATMAGAYGVAVMSRPTTVQCAPQIVAAPGRGSFDVRVFNASGINGVAGDITKQLTKRGFAVKETSTISALASSGPATIQHGSAGLDQALLLAQQVPGAAARRRSPGHRGRAHHRRPLRRSRGRAAADPAAPGEDPGRRVQHDVPLRPGR